MNDYRAMFERLLFEFNWGQEDPENAITNPDQQPVIIQQIANSGSIEGHMAKYHNWFNTVHLVLKEQATDKLNNPEIIKYRETVLNAFQGRLQMEQPKHPMLIIFSRDCQAYQQHQDCI